MTPQENKPDQSPKAPPKNQGVIKLSSDTNSNPPKEKPRAAINVNNDYDSQDQTSKILGALFVVGGLLLIGVLIVFYILSKLPYRTDPNMPIPTLYEAKEYTNKDEIDISGEVVPGENVVLFKNGEMTSQRVKADKSGEFTFEKVSLEDEGDYEFQASTIRGFILRKRSEKSNTIKVVVDRSEPSNKIELNDYPERTNDEKITISGRAEKNATIRVKQDKSEYSAQADADGKFEIKDIELKEGKNEFKIEIEDRAGNKVSAPQKITVDKSVSDSGDLNGPGATDSRDNKLPEASGELSKALETIFKNNLMFAMGILALIAFATSSFGVFIYNSKQNR